jgi:Kef-type K+ transport system membrane component KefB
MTDLSSNLINIIAVTRTTKILPLTDPVYIICVLLMVILITPIIAKFSRLPQLVILIILGTILGTNVLGILARDQQLILLEKIGLLYIMLLAGIQIDLSNLQRLGKRAAIFGILTFSLPFILGLVTGKLMGFESWTTCFIIAILYSPHTLIAYPILLKFQIVKKEAVGIAVGGTVITSVLTLISLSLVQANVSGNINLIFWVKILILLPTFIVFYLIKIPEIGQLIFQKNHKQIGVQFTFVMACLFLASTITLLLGVDSIVGAFIAGLALNSLLALNPDLMDRIVFFGNSLFIPAFLISVGVLCNPRVLLSQPENLGIALLVIIGAVGGKFLAAFFTSKVFNLIWSETMLMFSLTISRAALVLVIALYGKSNNLLSDGLFNAIIVYIIVTCLFGPILVDIFGKKLADSKS